MGSIPAVPEILEAILLRLDMTTLLVSAPRVSRSWNLLIQESPSIQRALFFQPVIPDEEIEDEDSEDEEEDDSDQEEDHDPPPPPIINPLLAKHFGRLFFDTGTSNTKNGDQEEQYHLFRQRAITFHILPWRPSSVIHQGTVPPYDLHPLEPSFCEPFTRRGASWRRMLIYQSSPSSFQKRQKQHIALISYPNAGNGNTTGREIYSTLIPPSSSSSSSSSTSYLRMGQLYDLVQHQAAAHLRHPSDSSGVGVEVGDRCDSLWFRVSWPSFFDEEEEEEEEDPTPLAVRQEIDRLVVGGKVEVVLELYPEKDDEPRDNHPDWRWWDESHPPCPGDLDRFDGLFRCEEADDDNADDKEQGKGVVDLERRMRRLGAGNGNGQMNGGVVGAGRGRRQQQGAGRGRRRRNRNGVFDTEFQIWNPERYRAGHRMEYLWGNPDIPDGGGWGGERA